MSIRTPAPLPPAAAPVSATKVTVIPISDHGLVAVGYTVTAAGSWCMFPTVIKPDPGIRTDHAASRLLAEELGCAHGVLRLVAVFDPDADHLHREAVYTTTVWWPAGRTDPTDPTDPDCIDHADCGDGGFTGGHPTGGDLPTDTDGDEQDGEQPTGGGARRLLPIATRDQADRHGLRWGRLAALFTDPDLQATAHHLPELATRPEPASPHPAQPAARRGTTPRRAAPTTVDNPARRFR